MLILRKSKPDQRKRKVLFIDASKRFHPGKNRNDLTENDVTAIHAAYQEGNVDGESGLALRWVDLDEIRTNEYDLNIGRYVTATVTAAETTVKDTLAAWMTARTEREQAETALLHRLTDAGFGNDDNA